MSIRQKLFINSITVIVLAISLIGIVIYSTLSIQPASNNIMPKFIALSEIQSDYLQVQNVFHTYANSMSVTQPQSVIDDAKIATEDYFAQITANIQEVEARITTTLEKEALQAFIQEHETIQRASLPAIAAAESGTMRTQAARINGALNYIHQLEVYTNTENELVQQQLARDVKTIITVAIIGIVLLAVVGGCFTLFTTRNITAPLRALAQRAELIADGQLSVQPMTYKANDEIGILNMSFTKMATQLKQLLSSIQQVSEQVSVYSNELLQENHTLKQMSSHVTDSTAVLSKGTQQIAQSLQETMRIVEHMNEDFTVNEQRSAHSVERSTEAANALIQSQQAIALQRQLIQHNLETSSELHKVSVDFLQYASAIEDMAKVVANISDQTNLLALNASIEAARAGEHGKGFAIVAEEVRKLAEQSNASTSEIFDIVQSIKGGIEAMTHTVNTGVTIAEKQQQSMAQTTASFTLIEEEVHAIMDEISTVASHIRASQHVGTSVLENVENVQHFVAQTADESTDMSNAANQQLASISTVVTKAEQLQQLAQQLHTDIQHFKM